MADMKFPLHDFSLPDAAQDGEKLLTPMGMYAHWIHDKPLDVVSAETQYLSHFLGLDDGPTQDAEAAFRIMRRLFPLELQRPQTHIEFVADTLMHRLETLEIVEGKDIKVLSWSASWWLFSRLETSAWLSLKFASPRMCISTSSTAM